MPKEWWNVFATENQIKMILAEILIFEYRNVTYVEVDQILNK